MGGAAAAALETIRQIRAGQARFNRLRGAALGLDAPPGMLEAPRPYGGGDRPRPPVLEPDLTEEALAQAADQTPETGYLDQGMQDSAAARIPGRTGEDVARETGRWPSGAPYEPSSYPAAGVPDRNQVVRAALTGAPSPNAARDEEIARSARNAAASAQREAGRTSVVAPGDLAQAVAAAAVKSRTGEPAQDIYQREFGLDKAAGPNAQGNVQRQARFGDAGAVSKIEYAAAHPDFARTLGWNTPETEALGEEKRRYDQAFAERQRQAQVKERLAQTKQDLEDRIRTGELTLAQADHAWKQEQAKEDGKYKAQVHRDQTALAGRQVALAETDPARQIGETRARLLKTVLDQVGGGGAGELVAGAPAEEPGGGGVAGGPVRGTPGAWPGGGGPGGGGRLGGYGINRGDVVRQALGLPPAPPEPSEEDRLIKRAQTEEVLKTIHGEMTSGQKTAAVQKAGQLAQEFRDKGLSDGSARLRAAQATGIRPEEVPLPMLETAPGAFKARLTGTGLGTPVEIYKTALDQVLASNPPAGVNFAVNSYEDSRFRPWLKARLINDPQYKAGVRSKVVAELVGMGLDPQDAARLTAEMTPRKDLY